MTVGSVSTHLGEHPLLSWATPAGGTMHAALVPIADDGRIESGSMHDQATLVLDDLVRTVCAAGGDIENIAQVICDLTDVSEVEEFNKVWSAPMGSHRAVIGARGLAVEGIRVELVAYAHIG